MKNVIRFLKDNNDYFPFLRFLSKNGCVENFFENLMKNKNLYGSNKDEYIINYLKYTPKEAYFSYAFSWRFTNEGTAYWVLIHQKWVDNLSRYKK